MSHPGAVPTGFLRVLADGMRMIHTGAIVTWQGVIMTRDSTMKALAVEKLGARDGMQRVIPLASVRETGEHPARTCVAVTS